MARRRPLVELPPLDLEAVLRDRLAGTLDHLRRELAEDLAVELVRPMEPSPHNPAVGTIPRGTLTRRELDLGVSWILPGAEDTWSLPLPCTVGDALEAVEAGAEELVCEAKREIRRCAEELVKPELCAAVLARRWIPERWPWPGTSPAGVVLPRLLVASPGGDRAYGIRPAAPSVDTPVQGLLVPVETRTPWPPEAAPLDVARWARDGLNRAAHEAGELLLNFATAGLTLGNFGGTLAPREEGEPITRWPAAGVALLYLAEREVLAEREKPRIALDAGRPHHGMIAGLRDLRPKRPGAKVDGERRGDRIEVLPRGRPGDIQLALPLQEEPLHAAAVKALRDLVKAEGLRHWTALLRLLSVEGGRRGWVRWTMHDHLDALGYSPSARRNPDTLDRIARQVELLTLLELAIYGPDRILRERRPLLHVRSKLDRETSPGRYRLEGMELGINPALYEGVRNQATGELGSHWFPAPVELARINHNRFPYAISAGLLLSIRFRWALSEGRGFLTLAGHNLLALAGVPWTPRWPAQAWERLTRTLEELQRIGLLGTWTWRDGAPSQAGICTLTPAEALLDRAIRGVIPVERPPAELPLTGAELRAWREARGWTQAELARRVGRSARTIRRAEGRGEDQIPVKLREALHGAKRCPE